MRFDRRILCIRYLRHLRRLLGREFLYVLYALKETRTYELVYFVYVLLPRCFFRIT